MTDPILAALQPSENPASPDSKNPQSQNQKKNIQNPPEDHGVDDELYSLEQKKKFEEYRKTLIMNEQSMNNLFSRPLFLSMMAELSQAIQTAFVDIPRRESARLASLWKVPEKEKDIEIDLGKIIENAILSVQENIERLSDDGVFE